MFDTWKNILYNPKLGLVYATNNHMFDWMSDKCFLKFMYFMRFGKRLNLKNPQTFNEKLQWLKLHDRKPQYTQLVDKYAVREYIKEKLGEEYLIPLLGVWDDPDDIDFDELPNQFVLKCNHNSAMGLCICTDKSNLNIDETKRLLKKGINQNFYLLCREWPYKDVPRKIVAEKYMVDENDDVGVGLIDYKFYCFNGRVEFLYVSQGLGNHKNAKINFLTPDWQLAPFGRSDYDTFDTLPKKPKMYSHMVEVAEILSKDICFLRVDLYEINGEIYFGELTFSPGGGFTVLEPEEWDYKLGQLIDLEKVE